ncbi:AAA family ATPase [Agrobacterium tumefaciens]|nr:AAA family ATPase [Agrobacterium tumefaciens]NTE19140.1 AAA family ATPase [Agrobacterium tumefaciens]
MKNNNKEDKIAWHEIHKVIVNTLLKKIDEYSAENVGIHLLKLFLDNRNKYGIEFNWLFKSYDIVQRKLESKEWFTEPHLDPLQIFASINNKASREENRIQRIRALLDTLSVDLPFNGIDFEGCPTPVIVQGIQLKTDKEAIILWNYFQKVESEQYIKLNDFGNALQVYGIEATLLSIFTFWINPTKYIPLDKWTIAFLVNKVKSLSIKESLSQTEYLFNLLNLDRNISKHIEFNNNVIDLVKDAYVWQEKGIDLVKGDFKILAFKTCRRNKKIFKILEPDTYFILDSNLRIEDDELRYTYDKFNIFDSSIFAADNILTNDLTINVNAIVGKNGSGKSTLLELFYMMLYNLSLQLGYIEQDRHEKKLYPIESINFEVYFEYIDILKLSFQPSQVGHTIEIFKGKVNNEGILVFEIFPEEIKNYANLFYNIIVNYSMYSLNSLDYKGISNSNEFDWLSSLTHKNDSYQTPIVITPMRENGDIKVNLEKSLTRQRLLLNLLRLHNKNDVSNHNYSFRSLDNKKIFTHVEIVGETEKIKRYRNNINQKTRNRSLSLSGFADQYEELKEGDLKKRALQNYFEHLSGEIIENCFEDIKNHYKIDKKVDLPYQLYLLLKIYKMCWYYKAYHKFYKIFKSLISSGKINLISVLRAVDQDNSHVTDKFKQTINYLKSNSLFNLYSVGQKIHLDDVNDSIEIILRQGIELLNYPKKVIKVGTKIDYQHLIIPPIFNYEYYYNDSVKADTLSSGEQQQLNSFGNILYHIKNLESKYSGSKGEVQYRFVNIILDEIELYFHPEYQRKYIYKLIRYLSSASIEINNIWGINLLFSTHSPFILSDISNQKILRIADGKPSTNSDGLNSFAANIHDLLKDEFFMDGGTMGEFAKRYVNKLIEELTFKDDNKKQSEENYKNVKESLKNRIEIIGEPLIKNSLMALWHENFNVDDNIPSYEELIAFYRENNIN